MLKSNWKEVKERYEAFWRGEPLDRPPVIFDTVGPWQHPMYRGSGYDYTKYDEDITRFGRDYRDVWVRRADCPANGWSDRGGFLCGNDPMGFRNERMSFDPNGPSLERVLFACREIETAGRRICFQISYDENLLRTIFKTLRPESCMFYFGYARDKADVVRILEGIAHMTSEYKKGS